MSNLIRGRSSWRLLLCVGMSVAASAQAPVPPQLRGFPTPEAAADALAEAIRTNDDRALTAMLGSSWHEFAPGSDRDDDEIRTQFLKAWDESHKIIPDGPDKGFVRRRHDPAGLPRCDREAGQEWRFDVEAGRKEMQARLIGRNELAVIQTMLAIVDAQRDYAALDPMKVGVPVYARRLAQQSRPQGRAILGKQSRRAGKVRWARWLPRRSPARSRSMATTAIAFGCSTAKARMRRAAPTTIWSRTACWVGLPSSPGLCAGARRG